MKRDYWLGQQRESFMLAQAATSAEARLIHYHRTGVYSVEAVRSASAANDNLTRPAPVAGVTAPRLTPSSNTDERYYRELALGAQYLASQAPDAAQAAEHYRMAANYLSRARET